MSAIANQTSSGYTIVSFKADGDGVAGRIVGFEDYPVMVFGSKDTPKLFPSGDQIYGTKIHLETDPGNEDSRVTVWAEKANMLKAIGGAFRAAGRADLVVGDDLAISRNGMDGRAQKFDASYVANEDA